MVCLYLQLQRLSGHELSLEWCGGQEWTCCKSSLAIQFDVRVAGSASGSISAFALYFCWCGHTSRSRFVSPAFSILYFDSTGDDYLNVLVVDAHTLLFVRPSSELRAASTILPWTPRIPHYIMWIERSLCNLWPPAYTVSPTFTLSLDP